MFNSEGEKKTRTAVWSEVPELAGGEQRDDRHQSDVKGKGFQVTDVWTGKDLGCIEDQYEVELESHDIAALVVEGAC